MKAFVTGGTGLLGNNLVRFLVEQGFDVKALVRSMDKGKSVLGDLKVTLVQGDMNDVESFAHELRECDVLFHTAAFFRETFSVGDHWPKLERINIKNTLRLFELAEQNQVGRIIHVSSSNTILKRTDGKPSDEQDVRKPEQALTLYGRSKIIGDQAIARFMQTHFIPIVTVMPGWMLGPNDAAPTSGGKFVLDFLNKRLPGNVPVGIDVVDVRDVAQAMVSAVTSANNGDRYLLSGRHVTLAELCEEMEGLTGIKAPRMKIPLPIAFAVGWLNDRMAAITKKETAVSLNGVRELSESKKCSSAKAIRELKVSFRPVSVTLRDSINWYAVNWPKHVPSGFRVVSGKHFTTMAE
jgi:dihydroflavonol-4-reductase